MLSQVISVDVPNHMELVIAETGPGVKGNTVSGGTKEAILETGARILVMHTSWSSPNTLEHAASALTHTHVRKTHMSEQQLSRCMTATDCLIEPDWPESMSQYSVQLHGDSMHHHRNVPCIIAI